MDRQEKRQTLAEIKAWMAQDKHAEALLLLKQLAEGTDDFALQQRYAALWQKMPESLRDGLPVRIAVLASHTVDHLRDVMSFWLGMMGLSPRFFQAEYNTIHSSILDVSGKLYEFQPEITMILPQGRDHELAEMPAATYDEMDQKIKAAVAQWVGLWNVLQSQSESHIIQSNADIPPVRVFGNYDAQTPHGLIHALRSYNLELARAARPGVTIFDMEYLSSWYGKDKWYDERYWYHSKHAFAPDATGLVAYQGAALVAALRGRAKKCLVLDLDHTLWGGVVADDGWEGIELGQTVRGEAFVDFQKYLLQIKRRGIILAVCSKNDENKAQEPFLHHPQMQLRLEDVACFVANWRNKADNLRYIADVLNLGLDAFVFVDDNPTERALVRQLLPQVASPEMGSDPTRYIRILDQGRYFETVTFSDEDAQRNDYYRRNAQRVTYRETFTDLSAYLQSLHMVATVSDLDRYHLPRAAQLINKSNQFHLTNHRYTETQLSDLASKKHWHLRGFSLSDKFGDYGLISVVILEQQAKDLLFIDTWVMSCRVLSKGMEAFICREMMTLARTLGCKEIVGSYVPSSRNQLVAELYPRLKFVPDQQHPEASSWLLRLDHVAEEDFTCYIQKDHNKIGTML